MDLGDDASLNLVVVMPVYNEAFGISEFLKEIDASFADIDVAYLLIDDCSTDSTRTVLEELAIKNPAVMYRRNPANLGHGPSTIKGLRIATTWNPQFILAVDGDGQFHGHDIRSVYDKLRDERVQIVEGARTEQTAPFYRRAVSFLVRVLVGMRSRSFPLDANTPLRGYKAESLAEILSVIPENAWTPNLLISAVSRYWNMGIAEVPVASRSRRGPSQQGSTWGETRLPFLPTRKFAKFCYRALLQWVRSGSDTRSQRSRR